MRLALCFAALLSAAPLQAQLLGPNIFQDTTKVSQKPSAGAIRLAASSGGFVWGAVVGGFIGHESQANDCTKCASRKLNALVGGAIIGGSIGAAFGASFLNLRSPCSFNHRLVRSLIGASVATGVAFTAAGGLSHAGHSAFFVPVAAVGGALATLGNCWKASDG